MRHERPDYEPEAMYALSFIKLVPHYDFIDFEGFGFNEDHARSFSYGILSFHFKIDVQFHLLQVSFT